MKKTTLVIPCLSGGGSPMLAIDMFILNEPSVQKIGYIRSEMISPQI